MQPPIEGDTYDPCATYIKLRDARLEIITGGQPKRVRFKNGEEERETEFNATNLDALEKAMNEAKAECQFSLTGQSRRSAIGIGRMGPGKPRVY